jgi:ferredoxin-type protein NapH
LRETSDNDRTIKPAKGDEELCEDSDSRARKPGGKGRFFRVTWLRRIVLFTIIALFLLQFFKIKLLVGGLTGSVALWFVRLLDLFAYLESLLASMDFTTKALISVLPILGVYIIFGRAFCGWVCPMDFLFAIVDRARRWRKMKIRVSPKLGYFVLVLFLAGSLLTGIPLFTNYISHLTNFFRAINAGVFLALDLPVDPVIIWFSGGVILILLVLEFFFPRLWCRVICPVGKTYGLLNKISLIKLKFAEGRCNGCFFCERVCYMDVKIVENLERGSLRDTNCIYCGRCIKTCNKTGKLISMGLW